MRPEPSIVRPVSGEAIPTPPSFDERSVQQPDRLAMIVGVGIDLVSIERVRALVERHGERGRRRLFTRGELDDCDGRIDPAECLAARFAAKEAALKALGTGKRPELRWTEIQVVEGKGGKPALVLSGGVQACADRLGVTRVLVSLTHEVGVAGAIVVMESR